MSYSARREFTNCFLNDDLTCCNITDGPERQSADNYNGGDFDVTCTLSAPYQCLLLTIINFRAYWTSYT
jgi:hypothetical protein